MATFRWIAVLVVVLVSPLAFADNGQPWPYTWDRFPSLFFAASPIRDLSIVSKLKQFQLVIVEYREEQFQGEESGTNKWADGDEAGAAVDKCVALSQEDDAPPCLSYRNGLWAGTMYEQLLSALGDDSNFFTFNDDCQGFLDYPLNIVEEPPPDSGFDRCYYDWRQQSARDTFTDLLVNASNESPSVQGVFIDNVHSITCDDERTLTDLSDEQYNAVFNASLLLYANIFGQLSSNDYYPILSTNMNLQEVNHPLVTFDTSCFGTEEEVIEALDGIPWARNYEFWMWQLGDYCRAQVENALLETTKYGIPIVVHQGWFPEDEGCLEGCFNQEDEYFTFDEEEFLEFGMAAFLMVANDGSYFGYSNMQDPDDEYEMGGWAEISWRYHEQYDEVVSGPPVTNATQDGYVFRREFANGEVMIDCTTGYYNLLGREGGASSGVDRAHSIFFDPSRSTSAAHAW